MKMTLSEVLACPVGMSFEEYGRLLQKKKSLERKLNREADNADNLRIELDVLMDEEGSERYRRTAILLRDTDCHIQEIRAELNEVKRRLRA